IVVHRPGIPYIHLAVKFANRAAHCGEHRREGVTGAHREGSERDQLVPWQIDRRWGFLQAAEADVAGDPDHRPPVPAVATEESQPLANRVLARPQAARHRLTHDHDLGGALPVAGQEAATTQDRNPEGAEVFGPSTFEGYRRVARLSWLPLALPPTRGPPEVRSHATGVEDGRDRCHTL